MMGIYSILNRENGKRYIGAAHDVDKRIYFHLWLLFNGDHNIIELQQDFNWFGSKSFEIEVLEVVDTILDLVRCENKWISHLNTIEEGYNSLRSNSGNFTTKGVKSTIVEDIFNEVELKYKDKKDQIIKEGKKRLRENALKYFQSQNNPK